jgi:hypothetical protein
MQGPSAFGVRRGILAFMVAGLVLGMGRSGHADISVSVEPATIPVNAGSIGNTLEIDLTNTGPAVNVAGFSFEISVPTSSGVTFTGADTSTSATYIFAGNSLFGPIISSSPPGTTLDAGDLAATLGSFTTVGPGATTFGLGLVSFDVAGSATGTATVSFNSSITTLTAPDGSNIPINTLNNGTITIQSPSPVPEPATFFPVALGLLGLSCLTWRKHWRARGPAR